MERSRKEEYVRGWLRMDEEENRERDEGEMGLN